MFIYRRGELVRNTILFIFLSFGYLYVLSCLHLESSVLLTDNLVNYLKSEKLLLVVGVVTFASVYWLSKRSRFFFPIFILLVSYESIQWQFLKFDKFILMLNFLYIVLSFYFLLAWNEELKEPIFNPGFSRRDIGTKSVFNIPVYLETPKGEEFSGYLTNWGKKGCFINIENAEFGPKGKLKLRVSFEGKDFTASGRVVSKYSQGVGIRIQKDKSLDKVLDWKLFYDIIEDRGYTPHLVDA